MKEEIINFFSKENPTNKKPLVVFDLANNHNGDINHGLRIINEIYEECKEFKNDFIFGFKFQYRNLDTFIHPDYKERKDFKYVKRFSETRLKEEEFIRLKEEIDKLGLISVCTPFDEDSVDSVEKHNFDFIKIASCSLTDWPLLERIAKTDKPILASTAGSTFEDLDKVASFLINRNKKFCLMHCVAEYPTKRENLQLNQIELLKKRYPGLLIGFSTHEEPDNIDSIKIAIAKGAVVFERHVDVKSDKYSMNLYSSTPAQIKNWLQAARDAFSMHGLENERYHGTEKEKTDLRGLRRGVFAKINFKIGEKINLNNVFYAIPSIENQMTSNDMSKYIFYYAKKDINEKEPILFNDLEIVDSREKIRKIVYADIKELLTKANLPLPKMIELELSHHYGIDKFHEFGCTMINVINRDYCKKFIIILPGQTNPNHLHKLKEESFIVNYGDVIVNIEGEEKEYRRGEVILINREKKHSFTSKTGGIFEEISTTHYKNDSYYEDGGITNNPERKTYVKLWLNE